MIQITQQVIQQMKEHAIKTFPNECCGFLFGSLSEKSKIIDDAIEVKNSKQGDQRRRFEISPEDYMQGELYSEQHQTVFAGIYHSHPNHPAIPSEHDRNQAVPFFSYVILSVNENQVVDIKSWKLDRTGNFKQEKIQVLEIKKV